ncbi:hypothetical protein GGI07_004358 [Coemansia sp. Benny D115]|nr:hypothetical protein GGI07_004358 [Coemansia sp. Benny D115]
MMEIVDSPDTGTAAFKSTATSEQVSSLKRANQALALQYVCLSRIREPLGLVGGYWEMEDAVVNRVTAGAPCAAVRGVEEMCRFFRCIQGAPQLDPAVQADVGLFIERASDWIAVNQVFQPSRVEMQSQT